MLFYTARKISMKIDEKTNQLKLVSHEFYLALSYGTYCKAAHVSIVVSYMYTVYRVTRNNRNFFTCVQE